MVRRRLQMLRLFAAALSLLLLLAACSTFGSGIPEEPPSDSSYRPGEGGTAEARGFIRTGGYRVTTPAGWRYRRLDPSTNGGVFLLGRSTEGRLTYLAQRIEIESPGGGHGVEPEELIESTIEYLAERYKDAGLQTAIEEVDGATHVLGWSDTERVVTVVRPEGETLLLVSLEGEDDSVWLAEENRRRIAGSLTLVGESDVVDGAAGGPAAVSVRMDGKLPEFRCTDPNWEWLCDEENGVVVTGALGGAPCVVSVSSRSNPTRGLELIEEAPEFALFTGVSLYRAQLAEAEEGNTVLLLQNEEATYTVALEPSQNSSGEPLFTHPELLALLEHGIIFDQAELDRVATRNGEGE